MMLRPMRPKPLIPTLMAISLSRETIHFMYVRALLGLLTRKLHDGAPLQAGQMQSYTAIL